MFDDVMVSGDVIVVVPSAVTLSPIRGTSPLGESFVDGRLAGSGGAAAR
ncbi:hypothetical protein ABH935_009274 [Catenulispora sp. GAS73]